MENKIYGIFEIQGIPIFNKEGRKRWHVCIIGYIFIKLSQDQEQVKTVYQTEQCVHGIFSPSDDNPQRYEDHSQKGETDCPDGLAHLVMDYLEKKMNQDDTMARF